MASGKLSPRQKMINMMYLVLIALLALNVSKEILKAFHMFEMSFINANKNTDEKNSEVMAMFKANMDDEQKRKRTEKYFLLAEKAQKISKDFCAYVEKTKTDIITNAGGRKEPSEGETGLTELSQPDNMEKHANYFIPEGGGNGKKLQDKVNETRKQLLALLNDVKDGKTIAASLDKTTQLKAEDPKGDGLSKSTWVSMYLEHAPLAGVVTLLTKIQNDCKALEADVMTTLASSIDKATVKFDKQLALIMPEATNVMSGNAFTAKVALAAYNSTVNAKMLVNGSPVTVENGVGKISIPAQGVGSHTVTAKIETIDPETGAPTYIEAEPIEWTSFLPSAAISADAMNALYIGLDNPMSISVPGVTPENTIVSAGPGISLTKTGSGKFIARVTSVPGNKSSITVSAKIGGATKKMGEQIYKIRPVPKPIPMLGSLESGSYAKAIIQNQGFMNAYLSNFVFDGVTFKVTKFRVILASKRKGIKETTVTGNNFAPAKGLIGEAAQGDIIVIDGIRATGPGGEKLLGSLTFTIQ